MISLLSASRRKSEEEAAAETPMAATSSGATLRGVCDLGGCAPGEREFFLAAAPLDFLVTDA
jgi:hypothetical protein